MITMTKMEEYTFPPSHVHSYNNLNHAEAAFQKCTIISRTEEYLRTCLIGKCSMQLFQIIFLMTPLISLRASSLRTCPPNEHWQTHWPISNLYPETFICQTFLSRKPQNWVSNHQSRQYTSYNTNMILIHSIF